VNSVSPIRTISVQGTRGRLTKTIGKPATMKRNAVNCGAEKSTSAILMAGKAKPHTTDVQTASAMSRPRMTAAGLCRAKRKVSGGNAASR
jgi:hypothetical protein